MSNFYAVLGDMKKGTKMGPGYFFFKKEDSLYYGGQALP